MRKLKVREIDEKTFLSMRRPWNELLSRSRSDAVFLTWEWLSTWWIEFKGGKSLFLLTIWEDEKKLVAIFPLFIEKVRLLKIIPVQIIRFLGTEDVSSEYLDFILEPGLEEELIEKFVEYLSTSAKKWDLLFLGDVRETAENAAVLQKSLRNKNILLQVHGGEICPFIPLPNTMSDFESTLSPNMRYHIRRRNRAFFKELEGRFVIQDLTNSDDVLSRLFKLHGLRWNVKGKTGNFVSERIRNYHRRLVPQFNENGWLRMYFLEVKDRPIAVMYGLTYHKKFYYYQSGFDPDFSKWSAGVVLMKLSVEQAISEKLSEFDYLRGNEEYKRRWTQSFRNTSRFYYFQHNWKGKLLFLFYALKLAKKRVVSLVAQFQNKSRAEAEDMKKS